MSGEGAGHPLVRRVAELDRAGLATLRRSLSFPAGTWPPAFPFVEPFVARAQPWPRAVAYLVAGLMAWSRAGDAGEGDMGAASARLRAATDSGSVERRFLNLLEADREALPHRLRQMVTLMASKGIAPAWSQLIHDLTRWDSPDRYVQQRWARSFYALEAELPSDVASPEPETASTILTESEPEA
jgi:CRISPR system Cascade subunit CasB